MLNIVLYRPQMPENVGNIIRLCANFNLKLHIVGPLLFFMDDKRLMRAGLDYHDLACKVYHTSFEAFMASEKPTRLIAATTHGHKALQDFSFMDNDYIIFGREKEGLGSEVLEHIKDDLALRISMHENSRCLNVANSVAIFAYEALRQQQFIGLK